MMHGHNASSFFRGSEPELAVLVTSCDICVVGSHMAWIKAAKDVLGNFAGKQL